MLPFEHWHWNLFILAIFIIIIIPKLPDWNINSIFLLPQTPELLFVLPDFVEVKIALQQNRKIKL